MDVRGQAIPGECQCAICRVGSAAVAAPELSRNSLWGRVESKGAPMPPPASAYCFPLRRTVTLPARATRQNFHRALASEIEGTAPLRAIDIFRGTERISSVPVVPRDATPSGWLRISWNGASGQGNWQRARMIWDGHIDIAAGRILAVEDDWRDTVAEGVACWSTNRVEFSSITAGNWNAVKLKLDETPETVISCGDVAAHGRI